MAMCSWLERVLGFLLAEVAVLGGVDEQHLVAPAPRVWLCSARRPPPGCGVLEPKKRFGARPITASKRSSSRRPRRILPSVPPRKSTPWGSTTPTMPLALATASMCSTKAKSPLVLGGEGTVAVEAVVGIVSGEVAAPVLQTERRIGDDAVVRYEAVVSACQSRLGDDVAFFDSCCSESVQEQVELADSQGAPVAFLPVQHQIAFVSSVLFDVLRGVDQHPAGACGGIADAHALVRSEQFDYQADHGTGSVELTAFPAGVVGELVDQILVGVSQDIAGFFALGPQVAIAEIKFVKWSSRLRMMRSRLAGLPSFDSSFQLTR